MPFLSFNQILFTVFCIFILFYMHTCIIYIFIDENFNNWCKYWICYAVVLYILPILDRDKLHLFTFTYLTPSENCRKLPSLCTVASGRFGSTNRIAREAQKKRSQEIKRIRYTLPDASRFRLYPLSVDRYTPEILERRWVSAALKTPVCVRACNDRRLILDTGRGTGFSIFHGLIGLP